MNHSFASLIYKATLLGGEDLCADGHSWVPIGGRSCPVTPDCIPHCSQVVYQCARCDEYDYGEKGGPGYTTCKQEQCAYNNFL